MTETQKLREALQAISHIDDTTNHSVDASAALDRIGQIARQALDLPTTDENLYLDGVNVEHNNAPAVPQGDEHAAFKSAMKAEYGLLKFDLTRSQGGGYQSLTTHAAYQGWKVARAASPAPAQEVGLTDELIKKAAGTPEGYKFAAKGISKIDVWPHGGNWFPLYSLAQVQSIVAALRAKGGK